MGKHKKRKVSWYNEVLREETLKKRGKNTILLIGNIENRNTKNKKMKENLQIVIINAN